MLQVNDIIKYSSTHGDYTLDEYYLAVRVEGDVYDTMDATGHIDKDYAIASFDKSTVLSYGTKEWNEAFCSFMKELDDWNSQVTTELKFAYKFVNKLKRTK